jgi:RES domain-containing protein
VIPAWRLARRVHSEPPAEAAFNGRGPELYGGRWNPAGLAAAYATVSRALAALEYLVHIDRDLVPNDLVFSCARFQESDVETCVAPRDWDVAGSPSAVAYGERWLREHRSLVLAVPSVVVRDELNYVINPRHPRFGTLIVAPVLEPFLYDQRLLRR